MIRRFLKDRRGNFAMLTAISMVPIMGALMLAIDYSEMSRRRQLMQNALDAAGIATARQLLSGATDAEATIYATDFFQANLSAAVDPADTNLTVKPPNSNVGAGTLELCSNLVYHPYFVPVFYKLIKKAEEEISFDACTEVQLQNTLEVALVLDNSGSMDYRGPGATGTRMELLREAAAELVNTFAARAQGMKQIEAPVQFSLVPFAASVNVGRNNALNSDETPKPWMDKDGISPIHHENFNWNSFPNADRKVTKGTDGIYYKKGAAWGTQENKKVTRFTLFDEMKYYNSGQKTKYTSWQGCVEARPYPYNIEDEQPDSSDPATLFVPMFAPDETDERDFWNRPAYNNWWADISIGNTVTRQSYMPKYFDIASIGHVAPSGTSPAGLNQGPNASCSTTPITPLADLSVENEKKALLAAIQNMSALGATNVPEGLAWGWRTLSNGEPFTTGRPSTDRGNDKVVIVLTDGANTYYTPESLGKPDFAGNKSIYSAFGYARMILDPTLIGRIFQGAPSSINKTDYSNPNYTNAMNYLFDDGEMFDKKGGNTETLCNNVREDNTMIITVSLDLDSTKPDEKAQMAALKNCASTSKYDDEKILYYNATSKNLKEIFEEIAKELSNLRITS
jgi:Flp pilus assembly protein TadG